ncbi:MAG: BON domain-containing protein [Opitutaceae bacterium]|jgi:osmotically-inducible protein OsmY
MKTSPTLSRILSLTALIGTLSTGFFVSGCAGTSTKDSTGEYVNDTIITTSVKKALLADDLVKSFQISVETVKNVVQLSGFVDTAVQKEAAGKDAAAVSGVHTVHNNLIVK